MRKCTVKDCNNKYYALGYCGKHYQRYKKYGDPEILQVLRGLPIKERLEKKIKIDQNTGCWMWTASVICEGYGQINYNGRMHRAHRLSYQVYKGVDPGSSVVMHTCDNPGCINPEHLKLGTHKENMKDMKLKGRAARGENCGSSKLKESEVIEIYKSDLPRKEIAKIYNIGTSTIDYIKNHTYWRHITEKIQEDK